MKFRPFNFLLLFFLLGCFCRISAQPIEKTVPPPAAIAPASAPKFEVRAYHFEGETILPPERLSNVLSNYTGHIDLARIHGLGECNAIRGFSFQAFDRRRIGFRRTGRSNQLKVRLMQWMRKFRVSHRLR